MEILNFNITEKQATTTENVRCCFFRDKLRKRLNKNNGIVTFTKLKGKI